MESTDLSAYPQLLKQPVCTYSAADIERDGDQHCQVVGCARSMGQEKHYYRKFGVCEEHMKSPHIVVEGLLSRFCQQCGRFHNIESFDGGKRSCREMLLRHSTRRNSNKRPLSSSMRGPGLESSLATGDLSSTVNDVSSAISTGCHSQGQVDQGFSLRPKSLAATPAKSLSPAPSFSPSNHPSTSPNSTQSQLNMHLQPQPAHSSTGPLHDNFADFLAGRNPQPNCTTRHHAIPHSDSHTSMDRISPQDMVHELLASFLDGQEQPALAAVTPNIENPSCKSTPCSKRMRRFSENTSLSSLVPSTGWMMNLGEDQVSSQPGQPSNSNNSGPEFPANICDVLNKLSVADRERVRQWLAEHANDQTSQEHQSHHRMHAAAPHLDSRQMPRMSTQGPQMPGHVHDKNCGCRGTPFDLVASRCTDVGCHHGPFASCNTTNHRHGAHGCCDHTQGMNGAAPYVQQNMYHGVPSQHVKQECHSHSFSCSHAPKPGTAANAEMLPNLSTAAQQAWALAQSMYGGAPMPSGVSPQMLLERMARFMMPGVRSDDAQNEYGHANCQGHHCGHHHHTNAPEADNMLMNGLSTMNMHNNMQQFVNSTAPSSHPAYRMPASNGGEVKRYNHNHGPHASCSSCSSCTASRSATPQPAVAPGWETESHGPPDAPTPPAALSWMVHAADAETLAMFRPSLNREVKEGTQGSAQPWSSMDAPTNVTSNNPFLPNHNMSHAHGNTDDWNMPNMGGSRPVLSTRALQETQNFSMQRFLNNCLDGRVDGAGAMTQGMESFMDNEGYDPSNVLAGLNPALLSRPEFLMSVAAAAGGVAPGMAPR